MSYLWNTKQYLGKKVNLNTESSKPEIIFNLDHFGKKPKKFSRLKPCPKLEQQKFDLGFEKNGMFLKTAFSVSRRVFWEKTNFKEFCFGFQAKRYRTLIQKIE